jgi:hypothetical protein
MTQPSTIDFASEGHNGIHFDPEQMSYLPP